MSSLPHEFRSSRDQDNADVDPQDVQSISAAPREFDEEHETTAAQNRSGARARVTGGGSVVATIAIAVLLSTLLNAGLFIVLTERPFAKVASLFGVKTTSPHADELRAVMDQLNALATEHGDHFTRVDTASQLINDSLTALKNSTTTHSTTLVDLTERVDIASSEINRLKVLLTTPRPLAVSKPKTPPKPVVVITLLSVRSLGGRAWVTLRDGDAVSPLMTIGDQWHSVTLKSVDTATRSAELLINGAVTRAAL